MQTDLQLKKGLLSVSIAGELDTSGHNLTIIDGQSDARSPLSWVLYTLAILLSALLIQFGLLTDLKAEGSKNLTPGTNNNALNNTNNDQCGYLVHNSDSQSGGVDISYGFLKPASWVSPGTGVTFDPNYRLFIRLQPGEKLSYGVQRANDPGFTSSNYKNLILTLRYGTGDGTIVKQNSLTRNATTSYLLNTNQSGVIDSYAQAAAGPLPATGGYDPLTYVNNTGASQDFFIEFTQEGEYTDTGTQPGFNDLKTRVTTFNNNQSATGNRIYSVYNLWDFTVTGTDNQEKTGRLFSKAWAFSTINAANYLSTKFTMYPLVESRTTANTYYVKAIELAGLRPYAFFFVTNEFGSTPGTNRNTVAERRQSQSGNTTYAQYANFVNDPDQAIWPSATIPTVSITPRPYCRTGNTEVAFTTYSSETGRFDITITYAGNTRVLSTDVTGGTSATIIWDGLVNGSRVPAGQNITYSFTNRGAAVNFPLYDAENNDNGFAVRNIRPSSAGTDVLYWDDTKVAALGGSSLNGTASPAHSWTGNGGDAATVNTWTYGFVSAANNLTYTTVSVCDNDGDGISDDVDIDDDNDGVIDVTEALSGATTVDPGAFADATSPIRYLDVDYSHPIFGIFRDVNNDGVNDIFDTDLDGIPNHFDLDADGDGLADAFEAGITTLSWTNAAVATQASSYSTALGRFTNITVLGTTAGTIGQSVGTNGLPNAVENRTGATGTGDVRIGGTEVNTIRYTLPDTDQETFTANGQTVRNYNFLDLDSDNDGITDEIEALSSATYNTRKGQSNFNTDTDRDGIRDAYDGNATGGNAISTRTDTDSDGTADMFDLDSDNDNATRASLPIYRQTSDWTEGFDTNGDGRSGDEILAKARAFTTANPSKASYYQIVGPASGVTTSPFLQDSNNNGIPNFLDITSPYYHDDNFNGLVDIYDPLYNGTFSTAPGYVNATTDSYFRRAAVSVPLPVTLTSFTAQATGQDVVLKWATAQEVNNDHFVVERSFDGQSFEAVQQVKGQGTKSTGTAYAVTDAKVAAKTLRGTAYYRLRQVDTDGTEALSAVQIVAFSVPETVAHVYPSPATTQQDARLDLTTAAPGTYEVAVTDLTGRIIRTFRQAGGTEQQLHVSSLPTGVYLIQVQGNGQSFNQRLVKE